VWSRVPLLRALAELKRERTRGTVALYAALAVTMLVIASVPVCTPMQDQLARVQHARPSSLLAWAPLQVVPKMYSFGHRVWYSAQPLGDDAIPVDDDASYRSLWANHYPARAVRFERGRADVIERGTDVHLMLRTGYHGRRWITRFVVRVDAGRLAIEVKP
jgi:hypothetical protein